MDEASSSGTLTQRLQAELESAVGSLYEAFGAATPNERSLMLTLQQDVHEEFVVRGLRRLKSGYYVLDSSRPWLCYWILHSLALLGRPVDEDLYDRTVSFLEHCQDPNGGYAGGPGQMPHLATTYAATCALVTLGGEKALASINRGKILEFLLRMKDPCGGFRVHDNGEMDMRGSYTALAVAHLLDIMVPELVENVGEHVRSCQTYEGGIGGEPGAEAHGGYTFCGLAAVTLINHLDVLDLPSLINWVAFRQGRVEGGFQGRTNKLVDGCYSFWQGGCFGLLQQHMPELLAQQAMSAAALHAPQREVMSTSHDRVNTSKSEQLAAAESWTESTSDVVDVVPVEVEAPEEFHSPAKDVPAKDWHSDEDEVEYWDSDSKTGDNTAEKLFPMTEAVCRKGPLQRKIAEVVELADDWQGGAGGGVFGSTSNSTGSTHDLGSWDDVLCGPIFNSQALQAYVLLCCQDLDGGLRDKPGKPCDYYHTCYCLSGLAAAQFSTSHRTGAPPPSSGVLGPYSNLLEATHAVCNVRLDRYYESQSYFKQNAETLHV